jgi:hypothetical protein
MHVPEVLMPHGPWGVTQHGAPKPLVGQKFGMQVAVAPENPPALVAPLEPPAPD